MIIHTQIPKPTHGIKQFHVFKQNAAYSFKKDGKRGEHP